MKKFSFLFPILSAVLLFTPFIAEGSSISNWNRDRLIQQLEIVKREISVLKQLIENMNSRDDITASSYLAMDLEEGSVIIEKNPQHSYPVASVTKMMTGVIVAENMEKNEKIVLSEKMLDTHGHSPALFKGLEVTAENLLKASLIQSTNDAANALSYFKGKDRFVDLMNKKARDLGMHHTHFVDSHGLNPNNRSTAGDLAKLISYVHKEHPELLEISRDNDFWLPNEEGRLLKFMNTNRFYHLSNYMGGKNGYLPQAKQTSTAIFNINEKPVGIVILHSENREADMFSIIDKIKEGI